VANQQTSAPLYLRARHFSLDLVCSKKQAAPEPRNARILDFDTPVIRTHRLPLQTRQMRPFPRARCHSFSGLVNPVDSIGHHLSIKLLDIDRLICYIPVAKRISINLIKIERLV
jgi:hypothetical protein